MFFGILIRMYFGDIGVHNTPHFHAVYGEYEAVFDLVGDLIEGEFPMKQQAFVKAWALIHEEELRANWELAVNREPTFKIDPLK